MQADSLDRQAQNFLAVWTCENQKTIIQWKV